MSGDVKFESGKPVLDNDQVGVSSTAAGDGSYSRASLERALKRGLAAVVLGCGAALTFLSPVQDQAAYRACTLVVSVGAALGITSRGTPSKD